MRVGVAPGGSTSLWRWPFVISFQADDIYSRSIIKRWTWRLTLKGRQHKAAAPDERAAVFSAFSPPKAELHASAALGASAQTISERKWKQMRVVLPKEKADIDGRTMEFRVRKKVGEETSVVEWFREKQGHTGEEPLLTATVWRPLVKKAGRPFDTLPSRSNYPTFFPSAYKISECKFWSFTCQIVII